MGAGTIFEAKGGLRAALVSATKDPVAELAKNAYVKKGLKAGLHG